MWYHKLVALHIATTPKSNRLRILSGLQLRTDGDVNALIPTFEILDAEWSHVFLRDSLSGAMGPRSNQFFSDEVGGKCLENTVFHGPLSKFKKCQSSRQFLIDFKDEISSLQKRSDMQRFQQARMQTSIE